MGIQPMTIHELCWCYWWCLWLFLYKLMVDLCNWNQFRLDISLNIHHHSLCFHHRRFQLYRFYHLHRWLGHYRYRLMADQYRQSMLQWSKCLSNHLLRLDFYHHMFKFQRLNHHRSRQHICYFEQWIQW